MFLGNLQQFFVFVVITLSLTLAYIFFESVDEKRGEHNTNNQEKRGKNCEGKNDDPIDDPMFFCIADFTHNPSHPIVLAGWHLWKGRDERIFRNWYLYCCHLCYNSHSQEIFSREFIRLSPYRKYATIAIVTYDFHR